MEEVWSLGAAIELDTSKTDLIRFIRWLVEGKLENRGREMSPWRPLGWHHSCAGPRWVSCLSPGDVGAVGGSVAPTLLAGTCVGLGERPRARRLRGGPATCAFCLPEPGQHRGPGTSPCGVSGTGGAVAPPDPQLNLRPVTFTVVCWRMCHRELSFC